MMSDYIQIGDHSAHTAGQYLATVLAQAKRVKVLAQVKRAWHSPINIFGANRRVLDDRLSVAGKPARWTSYDRARCERHRLKVAVAEEALNVARAEQAKPYSLAIEIARIIGTKSKSTLSLLGAVGLAVTGLALGIGVAIEARKPDGVLVQAAMQTHEAHHAPTASDERDFLFGMLAFGVVLLIAGLHAIREWWRPAR
jgi:hypothetical protein